MEQVEVLVEGGGASRVDSNSRSKGGGCWMKKIDRERGKAVSSQDPTRPNEGGKEKNEALACFSYI